MARSQDFGCRYLVMTCAGLGFLAFGSGLAIKLWSKKELVRVLSICLFLGFTWTQYHHAYLFPCFMWLICAYEWRKTRAMIRTTLCCFFGIWWTFHFSLPLFPLLRCPSFPSQQPSRSLLAPLSKQSSYSASLFIDAHTHTHTNFISPFQPQRHQMSPSIFFTKKTPSCLWPSSNLVWTYTHTHTHTEPQTHHKDRKTLNKLR